MSYHQFLESYHQFLDEEGNEYGSFEVFYTDDDKPAGWYWWACFPGCLPDSDAVGPFDTKEDALRDAQR